MFFECCFLFLLYNTLYTVVAESGELLLSVFCSANGLQSLLLILLLTLPLLLVGGDGRIVSLLLLFLFVVLLGSLLTFLDLGRRAALQGHNGALIVLTLTVTIGVEHRLRYLLVACLFRSMKGLIFVVERDNLVVQLRLVAAATFPRMLLAVLARGGVMLTFGL